MKIDSLIMRGFGPFAGTEAIDFRGLSKAGLFLISGSIGTGKTSILDAICYALFGETTGEGQGKGALDGRSGAELRCVSAKPQDETSVELHFRIGTKLYRVVRNPDYLRAKASGQGTTKTLANATLYEFDKNAATGEPTTEADWKVVAKKVREVNSAVESVIGFKADQFRRVMVIPQGRYRDVLISPHDERQELLKRIFGTQVFERFAGRLAEVETQAEHHLKEIQTRLDDLLKPHPWAHGLAESDVLKKMEEQCSEAKTIAESMAAERDQAFKDLEAISNEIAAGKEVARQFVAYDRSQERVKELEKEIEASQAERATWLLAKKAELPATKLKQLRHLEGELQKSHEKARNLASEKSRLQKVLTEKEQVYEQAKGGAKECLAIASEIGKLEQQQKTANEVKEAYKRLQDNLENAKKAKEVFERDCSGLQAKNESVLKREQEAKEHWEDLDRRSREGLAARLALELRPEEACPVCGSLSHPQPAQSDHKLPTDIELEEARAALDHAARDREGIQGKLIEARAQLKAKSTDVERCQQEFGAAPVPSDSQALDQEVQRLEERKKQLQQAEIKAEREWKTAQGEYQESDGQGHVLAGVITDKEKQVEDAKQEFQNSCVLAGFETAVEVEAAMQSPVWLREATQRLEGMDKEYNNAKTSRDTLEMSLRGRERLDLAALEVDEKTKRERYTNLNGSATESANAWRSIEDLQGSFRKLAEDVCQAREAYLMASGLSKVVHGKVAGEEKISLHSWVLGSVMERVLAHATVLLKKMTQGRYQLIRPTEPTAGQGQKGLEIAVLDTWWGTERPARTLSGGETFLASLAVSLALAETAAEYQGGRPLETVFIDEGFGSLDNESLECAIAALQALRDQGRVVGVISHVDEMQRSITAQVQLRRRGDTTYSVVVGI